MLNSMSSSLTASGRTLFAFATLGFGVQYAIYDQLRDGPPMFPVWIPLGHVIAYSMAVMLIAAGPALLTAWRVVAISLALGLLLLVVALLYLGHMQHVLHDGGGRTLFLEAPSFASTALVSHGFVAGLRSKFSLMRFGRQREVG